jgi:quercetin dioxygenase-like cupin family protein
MPFVDTNAMEVRERLPGWRGKVFHSDTMTFAHWEFDKGAEIHAHHHAQEEVWHVVRGTLEVTIADETQTAGPGMVAIIPPNTTHHVAAASDGMAIVTDYPLRED